ncbi:hypothetical protein J3R74_000367 [Puniceicoccus vermicola]
MKIDNNLVENAVRPFLAVPKDWPIDLHPNIRVPSANPSTTWRRFPSPARRGGIGVTLILEYPTPLLLVGGDPLQRVGRSPRF